MSHSITFIHEYYLGQTPLVKEWRIKDVNKFGINLSTLFVVNVFDSMFLIQGSITTNNEVLRKQIYLHILYSRLRLRKFSLVHNDHILINYCKNYYSSVNGSMKMIDLTSYCNILWLILWRYKKIYNLNCNLISQCLNYCLHYELWMYWNKRNYLLLYLLNPSNGVDTITN